MALIGLYLRGRRWRWALVGVVVSLVVQLLVARATVGVPFTVLTTSVFVGFLAPVVTLGALLPTLEAPLAPLEDLEPARMRGLRAWHMALATGALAVCSVPGLVAGHPVGVVGLLRNHALLAGLALAWAWLGGADTAWVPPLLLVGVTFLWGVTEVGARSWAWLVHPHTSVAVGAGAAGLYLVGAGLYAVRGPRRQR